ncbi:MAG TPA: TolC family protein [Vicinamibacterales bacterium]|nr:TolC family protein [Vicinamibacterales bacterium]
MTPSRRLALAAFLAVGVARTARAQPPTLSLDETVRLALANNRNLSLAAQEVEKADEALEAAKLARLPKFNVNYFEPTLLKLLDVRLGPFRLPLPLPDNFAFLTGSATQPISQLYDIGLGVKAMELSKNIASERLRAARQTAVDDIKRAYYACLRAESGLVPSREAVDLFKELERVMDTLVGERAALESDRLDVQARRAQQEHDVLVLENALATAHERINVALGRDPEAPFATETLPLALPAEAELPAARAAVRDQRPDVREARIAIDLAKIDWRLKKAEQFPRVGAVFYYVGQINMPLLPGNIAAGLLQASWEPFDWGRKGREQASKQLAVRQAETALKQLEDTAAVDLNARARALGEARSLASVMELARKAAREKLRVMLDKHDEQAVLTKDLLQAQVAVAEADHNYQAALLAYWEARADFEKALAVEP